MSDNGHFEYNPRGVCSSKIEFDLADGRVRNLKFKGGCNGNLKAIGLLSEGMEAGELIQKLSGNTCGFRKTSCADQFAKALEAARNA